VGACTPQLAEDRARALRGCAGSLRPRRAPLRSGRAERLRCASAPSARQPHGPRAPAPRAGTCASRARTAGCYSTHATGCVPHAGGVGPRGAREHAASSLSVCRSNHPSPPAPPPHPLAAHCAPRRRTSQRGARSLTSSRPLRRQRVTPTPCHGQAAVSSSGGTRSRLRCAQGDTP
jgi:hypothetical protein